MSFDGKLFLSQLVCLFFRWKHLGCLRTCPVWMAGQVGAHRRCEDNCVSSDRFDSWASMGNSFYRSLCVSSDRKHWLDLKLCVACGRKYPQAVVRAIWLACSRILKFGWPAVDRLCVSSDRKRRRTQDKSRPVKAAGAEVGAERWHQKLHAAVAKSTFASQNAQNTTISDLFWKCRCRKIARRCGEKHILKWKC